MRVKKLLLVPVLIITIPLSGCQKNFFPIRYEIEQVDVVQVVGVDISRDDPSLVELTFMSTNQRKASTETGGGEQVVTTVSSTGATVFDAKRKLKAHSDKVVLLSHTQFFIFGEEAAKDDFTKYFDCFLRDSEIRFTPKVYIARGCTAKELMQKTSTGDKYLADRLKNMDHDVQLMSNFRQVNLVEVAGMLDSKTEATVIPALTCRDTEDEIFTGEKPEKDVVTAGYAVFKDFKLVGYFDEPMSRGYNFLTDNVMSSNYTVKDQTGMRVELEVTSAKVSLAASFSGETMQGVTYKADVNSIIREQQSREDIYTPASLKSLESQLSEAVRNEMLQIIAKSKEFETDAIGVGQKIELIHPIRWEKLKSDWNDTFMKLDIQVEVTAHLLNTLSIQEPNGYMKES
jgi:spore germination protein KC